MTMHAKTEPVREYGTGPAMRRLAPNGWWAAGCAGCDYVARDTDLDRATGRLTSHVMVAGLPSRAEG